MRQNILIVLVTALLFLAGAEAYYRIPEDILAPPRKGSLKYWHRLLEDLPEPERHQFLRDRAGLPGNIFYNYDLYATAPYLSDTITFTGYHSARLTPDSVPPTDAKQTIWTFGGSTMQNLETTDDRTIANTIASTLKGKGWSPQVKNFGVGSFQSSLELIKFQRLLARVPQNELPGFVVFYDGYNDPGYGYHFGAGNMQGDISSKLALMVEGHYGKLSLYALNEWLGQTSKLWEKTLLNTFRGLLFSTTDVGFSGDNLKRTADTYLRNTKMAKATCEAFGIRCLFVLQPLNVVKQGRTKSEEQAISGVGEEYQRFTRQFYDSVREAPGLLDLSTMFDGVVGEHFYDIGHTGPLVGIPIGQRIAAEMDRRWPQTAR